MLALKNEYLPRQARDKHIGKVEKMFSAGHKKIDIVPVVGLKVVGVKLNVTVSEGGPPHIKHFAAFAPCAKPTAAGGK